MSDQSLAHLRHSAAHLLAAAVLELRPDAKLAIGPATDDGFYYDVDFGDTPLSEESLKKIEKKMQRVLSGWKEFAHEEVSPAEAKKRFADNPYKLELIEEIVEKGEPITLYTAGPPTGGFTDLCRGGHVDEPNKALQHIRLLSLAGAYWRGDENNTMLTRIYGTAFETADALSEHLEMLEEAKKRDHRKLGKQLDLFTFSPLVGPGLPLFTPRGQIIREQIQNFIYELQGQHGYERVSIPHLAKPDLYKTSGHWDKFQDDIFHVRGKGENEFVLKPMNCPHHTQIFDSRGRSYRELPVRLSEITMMYRDEQQGELQGLSRVRSITIDDGHVFCRPDQIRNEIDIIMSMVESFYEVFGLELSFRLSLRDPNEPDKYLGSDEIWEQAEGALREVLVDKGVDFTEEEGEAAFYGPKIDFVARDSLRRQWQLATVQVDFNMPERFDLTYTDESGDNQRPVMVHRAVSGSLERFMAILIEHYAGALPLWLSPTQVAILPISEDQVSYAKEVEKELAAHDIRCTIDDRDLTIGKKIRESEIQKNPVMVIVGAKEAQGNTVSVRSRKNGDEGVVSVADFAKKLREEIINRA